MHKSKSEDGQTYVIALAGNPNVGKSTLFNALTGMHQHTGNWAGKTVQSAAGHCTHDDASFLLVDLPGAYGLCGCSAEEQAARDFICSDKPDAVIVTCDASCLERSLILALQVIAAGCRVMVCVNLLDEAKRRHISVNLRALEKALGVPVVGTAARRKQGLDELLERLHDLLQEEMEVPCGTLCPDDSELPQLVRRAEEICAAAVVVPDDSHRRDRRIDRILLGRFTGIPVMLLLLGVVLWLTMVGANYPSALLQRAFAALGELLHEWMHGTPAWLQGALLDGVYNVVTWVVAVMLPPMAIFFPLFTLLEDFGYLPRVAFQLDKRFQCAGTCGKQALCMCMGFGCNAAGVTGCRIIESPRERLIAILTNCFVPCNGRFPTLIVLICAFFTAGKTVSAASAGILVLMILLGVTMTLLISKLLSVTILRGVPSAVTLELPPYRRPQILKTLVRSLLDRTLFVLGRACLTAAPAGLLLWILSSITIGTQSILAHAADFLHAPAQLMGLDGTILLAFLLGIPANEIVMPIAVMLYRAQNVLTETGSAAELAGILTANGWTVCTALCTCLFMLFHFPCATTCLTIHKETGSLRYTLLAMLLPTVCGVVLCTLTAQIFALF